MNCRRQLNGARSASGFTLIELLIVVAIIAILAAIAVPNFMEAQTRSKISRDKADMRASVVALESFRIDHNFLPPDGLNWGGYPCSWIKAELVSGGWFTSSNVDTAPRAYNFWRFDNCFFITTPVAYMTKTPTDPFSEKEPSAWWKGSLVWENFQDKSKLAGADWTLDPPINGVRTPKFRLTSIGPDMNKDLPNYEVQYDPTNGTVSWGNIIYAQ